MAKAINDRTLSLIIGLVVIVIVVAAQVSIYFMKGQGNTVVVDVPQYQSSVIQQEMIATSRKDTGVFDNAIFLNVPAAQGANDIYTLVQPDKDLGSRTDL
jgi:hypothetical protein